MTPFRSQSLDKMNVKLTRTRKKITSSQKAAFKMRANHLVNSVSSPTKSLSVSGSSEIEPAKSESSVYVFFLKIKIRIIKMFIFDTDCCKS